MKRTAASKIVYDENTIRSAKPDWVGLLMELSNFNSNVTGGTRKFRRLQEVAALAAPAEVAEQIRNLPFQANTVSIHRHGVSMLLSAQQPPQPERSVLAQLLAASSRRSSRAATAVSSSSAAVAGSTVRNAVALGEASPEASPSALPSMPNDDSMPDAQPELESPTLAKRVCDFAGPPLAVLELAANLPSSETAVAGAYIRRCWRQAALALHPDKDQTSDPHRTPAFQRITAAYNELRQLCN